MDTLVIFIKRKWFDQIAKGEKVVEYREVKPFWTSRLYDDKGKKRDYRYIEFINGMNSLAPRLKTEYLGFSKRGGEYLIKVGNVLKRINC